MESLFEKNVQAVRQDIASACKRSGRHEDEVRLIGVTKTVTANAIQPLMDAGLRDFGENRWQQAREKFEIEVGQRATWHFIGHLQQNKVKYIVRYFDWIHSIDSAALGEEVSAYATRENKNIACLLQVNVARETQKHGLSLEQVRPVVERLQSLPGITLCGLMTMAPNTQDDALVRNVFQTLRRQQIQIQTEYNLPLFKELSMGMSNDYISAIEEGATMIRVGRRIMSN